MQHAGNKASGCPASEQWGCDATAKFFEQRDSTSLLGNWAESWNGGKPAVKSSLACIKCSGSSGDCATRDFPQGKKNVIDEDKKNNW